MANLVALVNGKSYEWSNIVMNVLGVPIVGVTNIEYKDAQEMENIYGAGAHPVSRGHGKNVPEAKITLLMEEVEALQVVAPNGRLQNIPEFDITVSFVDAQLNVVTHAIRNVRFMENGRTSSTGDTSIPVEMPLKCLHIDWV